MRRNLESALEDCLSRMQAGESLEDCLRRYPAHAAELRPLLILADDVRRLPTPRVHPAVKAAHERRMLAAVAVRFPPPAPRPTLAERLRMAFAPRTALRWGTALALVLILLLGGGWFSSQAAAGSLPGDLLYPLKVMGEQVHLWLTWDQVLHRQLETRFYQARLEEVRAVLSEGRQVTVRFVGELEDVSDTVWRVSGLPVVLTPRTQIVGDPEIGARVQVLARAPGDGTLRAIRLGVRSLPPRTPTATATATLSPTATMTPTATSAATATPTATSAATATPTATVRPSRTPRPPTATAPPSPTPAPTRTSPPTAVPSPTHTARPIPSPTRTAAWPTSTPHHTPYPTSTPYHTPRPTSTPHHTPSPSRTPHPTYPPHPILSG